MVYSIIIERTVATKDTIAFHPEDSEDERLYRGKYLMYNVYCETLLTLIFKTHLLLQEHHDGVQGRSRKSHSAH